MFCAPANARVKLSVPPDTVPVAPVTVHWLFPSDAFDVIGIAAEATQLGFASSLRYNV